jgi:hypothetical protein
VLVSAHLGHWYVQIAFAVPSLLLIGYMTRDSLRRRRRRDQAGTATPPVKSARKTRPPS